MTFHTRHQLEKKLAGLKDWLSARGAQVLATTNPYEVVRFRAGQEVAVVYAKGNGQLTYQGLARKALNAFACNGAWSAGVAVKRVKRSADERTLLERDGPLCFLCCCELGDDITVEHLVSVAHGGPNHIANKVLAHERCNQRMGHLSVMEKIALRDKVRAPA